MPFARGIHFTESGSGTPVVMIHSGGMSSRQWGRLATRLSATHRAIALDLLGYGQSPPARDAFTLQDDLDAVLAVVDAAGEPAHVVGHSYGGLLALEVARARTIRSLSLCEPVAFGVLHSTNDAEALADLGRYGDDASFGEEPGSERWLERFVDWWNGAGAWRAMPPPARQAFLAVGPKVYREVAGITHERTSHETWAALDVPTLLVCGANTTLAERHVCAVFARAMKHVELRTIEGAGHMAPITHADLVNAAIEAHVSRSR